MDTISWTSTLFVSFLILVIFWAIGKSSEYTLNNWVSILVKKTKTDLDDRILERVKRPLHFLILFAGVYIAFSRLPLEGTINSVLDGVIYVAGVAVAIFLIYSIFDEALKWYGEKIAEKTSSRLDKEFLPLIEKLLAIFIFLGGLIAVLKHFNQDIYSLVTALGVGSLAIGLAAKDTLANMISGFTIMVDRPFRPGDRVELDSGETGDVIEIGMRCTKINTFFNTILVVPNSDLVNSRLINHSYPDSKVSGRIDIGVAYGSDMEKVKETMVAAALSIEEVLRDPEPKAYFIEFGDSSLNLRMSFWVDDYSVRYATQDKINMEINRRFEDEGIEIPFPVRTIITKNEAIPTAAKTSIGAKTVKTKTKKA